MYLEKLEIQGFKSFANKTTLDFPAATAGIAAIVGPNGSGKSNIADAVRWVLGEQSLKQLRGKKSEDVIFSGSNKKARLGFAAVTIFLNNEERAGGIDFTHVAVSRRLFRDGSSEYLINNHKVRLSDVQLLLAQANFGHRTYSVIGQGMVDAILAATPFERKEFFDEATGVKQYQIKREQALQKIAHSRENLGQVNALLKEISPRLKQLERAAAKLEARGQIEAKLRNLQQQHYGYLWRQLKTELAKTAARGGALKTKRQYLLQAVTTAQEKLTKLEKETKAEPTSLKLEKDWQTALTKKSDLAAELKSLELELNFWQKKNQSTEINIDANKLLALARRQLAFLDKLIANPEPAALKNLHAEAATLQKELKTALKTESPAPAKDDKTHSLTEKINKLNQNLKTAAETVTRVEKELATERAAAQTSRTATFTLQHEYQKQQQELYSLTGEKNNADIEAARLETRRDSLEEEIGKELPTDLQKIVMAQTAVALGDRDLWPEIARTKHDLEMIGGIDPETISEYDTTKTRHDFLRTQAQDLDSGIIKTEQILKELDAVISREFALNFRKIETNFSEYFALLFAGGKAALEVRKETELENLSEEMLAALTDEEKNKLAAAYRVGIEIKASPAHKKVASISMLSGGERALTSIALICAIIRANPSPFVVLDEVDAALDEANSERFAAILEKLARYTQFVAITHNRATMERSSVLYGVTMGEDGVSKLLSVDLEKALDTTQSLG